MASRSEPVFQVECACRESRFRLGSHTMNGRYRDGTEAVCTRRLHRTVARRSPAARRHRPPPGPLSDMPSAPGALWRKIMITRNTFCGTWYLPHSHVHNERTVPIIMAGCMAIGACTKRLYFHFRSKIWRYHRVPRHRFSFKTLKFRRFSQKWALYCVFFIAHARNGGISTSGLKSDVIIVFLHPDFLKVAKISAIRVHLRQI